MKRSMLSRIGAVAVTTWLALAVLSMGSGRARADAGHPVGDAQVVTLDGTSSPAEVGHLSRAGRSGLCGYFLYRRPSGRVGMSV